MNVLNDETENEEKDTNDSEQVVEDEESEEELSESPTISNQDVGSEKDFETMQDHFVFENSENVNEHGIGTILLLGILLFDENENDLRSIRIPGSLYDAIGSVYFGPGSKAPMGRTLVFELNNIIHFNTHFVVSS